MRIGSALLATTAALALAFTAGSAGASTRHHARHHHARPAAAVQAQSTVPDTSQLGNNPAKRYKASHNANLREEATLLLTGNNPTKRYKARHDTNARMEATLSTKGNNPVRNYPAGIH